MRFQDNNISACHYLRLRYDRLAVSSHFHDIINKSEPYFVVSCLACGVNLFDYSLNIFPILLINICRQNLFFLQHCIDKLKILI